MRLVGPGNSILRPRPWRRIVPVIGHASESASAAGVNCSASTVAGRRSLREKIAAGDAVVRLHARPRRGRFQVDLHADGLTASEFDGRVEPFKLANVPDCRSRAGEVDGALLDVGLALGVANSRLCAGRGCRRIRGALVLVRRGLAVSCGCARLGRGEIRTAAREAGARMCLPTPGSAGSFASGPSSHVRVG